MISKYVCVMFFSVVIASLSQVLLKKSAMKSYASAIREYLNIYVISGYGLLFLSMLSTVYAYSGMDYKYGPVIEALGNVLILVLSYLIFHERIGIRKIFGILCIIAGITIFNI